MHTPLTSRQQELLQALRAKFLETGFADFTIDSACKTFHCSKSTIYALGKSRDEIIQKIVKDFFREIATHTEASLAGHHTAQAGLEAYFHAISESLQSASPQFMTDLANEQVSSEIYATNTHAAIKRMLELLQHGVDNGEFRPLPAEFLASLIETTMSQIQQGHYAHALPVADTYKELGELVIYGIHKR
ncbi:TetR/AcrR family transcriptional regulator [Corynebacterium freiburgense]|uniref:TetR/AcrR family transcriptional regulator n=1 Tax=Corynebacterium freiburgense TaxID=556548 RepID=UPI00041708AE|nr:TetR/AcrR family transcriptional regulator [Corynebacterium freiburgense]WJZ01617.1 putative HTH-type transcriptional regulator YfiR [Corynebacterium freiburgense]